MLVVGAAIAFPVGYIVMKDWIEQYIKQTEMSAWVYASILFALMLAVVVCVGGKVYRTSRENPADAIKS
jgi:undecaprenyl pyrophosphate phosphatase UppP